jgi:putative acetyltransferase
VRNAGGSAWAFVDNERAIRLYERYGFQREGTHRAYAMRASAYADAVAMARLRGV